MSKTFFSFKQFTVHHDRCAMKVGTDGVLLGAWAYVDGVRTVLDIGTGTGLIALMVAQRCEATVTAIDIEADAVAQARGNVTASPWADRIHVAHQDIRDYSPGFCFDAIVSNPPYFVNSLKCPDNQRNTARHTDNLSAETLMAKVSELLHPEGRFSLIIPAEQVEEAVLTAKECGLFLSRHTAVITRPGLPPKRALLEFRKKETMLRHDELVIELERHMYSEDYKALTKDFYLKL